VALSDPLESKTFFFLQAIWKTSFATGCMRSARRCNRTKSSRRTIPRLASWARVACTRLPARRSTFVFSRGPRSRCTSRQCSPKMFLPLLRLHLPLLLHLVRPHHRLAVTRMYRCRSSRYFFVLFWQIEANDQYVLYCVCAGCAAEWWCYKCKQRLISPSPCLYAGRGEVIKRIRC
jgi:hypothetical protein